MGLKQRAASERSLLAIFSIGSKAISRAHYPTWAATLGGGQSGRSWSTAPGRKQSFIVLDFNAQFQIFL